MTNFATRSEEALKRFLRTAVVVDDHISFKADEKPENLLLNSPLRGELRTEAVKEAPARPQNNELDGHTLVQEFLKLGVLCTLLEQEEIPCIEQLLMADILILDWKFGDNGGKAINCIRDYSKKHPHAIHFICIYTSEEDIDGIYESIQKIGGQYSVIDCYNGNEKIYNKNIIQVDNTYISVMKKYKYVDNEILNSENHNDEHIQGGRCMLNVSEKDLPGKLITIFAKTVKGLMLNAVLHAVGAMRDNTYTLINRFSPSLDPAFLSHRVYSNPCEDTEQHIIPLICSEISSILSQGNISEHLNIDAIKDWIADENTPRLHPEALDLTQEKSIDDYIENFLINGIKDIDNLDGKIKKKISNFKESSMTNYWGSENPICADVKLAMLMSCEYIYNNSSPILKFGTVIKDKNDNFYVCVQPPCDCVRIEKSGRNFIFSPMIKKNKNSKYNFVFFNDDNIEYYSYNNKAYKIKSIKFSPQKENTSIYASKENDEKWHFRSIENEDYILIVQLKEIHALKIINEHAANLSRIGLMESDWLRRCGQ